MRKKVLLIPFIIFTFLLNKVHGMVYLDGNIHLDLLYQKSLRYQHHRENYQTSLLEGPIPSGLQIKKRPAINAISDTFEEQWNFVLYDAEKKLVQLLSKESERIVKEIEIQIETEISNDYTTTGSTSKQLKEKHLKFRQQSENRRAKKWKKFKERSRKGKYDGVVQQKGKRVANAMKQLLDDRSDPLKKTESDILLLNVKNSVLTDNKKLDRDF